MKHLQQIITEFSKFALSWNDLSLEQQKGYLKRHPKSKRRITAKPSRSSNDVISDSVSLINKFMSQPQSDFTSKLVRESQKMLEKPSLENVNYLLSAWHGVIGNSMYARRNPGDVKDLQELITNVARKLDEREEGPKYKILSWPRLKKLHGVTQDNVMDIESYDLSSTTMTDDQISEIFTGIRKAFPEIDIQGSVVKPINPEQHRVFLSIIHQVEEKGKEPDVKESIGSNVKDAIKERLIRGYLKRYKKLQEIKAPEVVIENQREMIKDAERGELHIKGLENYQDRIIMDEERVKGRGGKVHYKFTLDDGEIVGLFSGQYNRFMKPWKTKEEE